MSPCLKAVVDGILLALPEVKAALRTPQPRGVRRKLFQLALGEELVDLTGCGLLDVPQGREDPIPEFHPDAHRPLTLAGNRQHRKACPECPPAPRAGGTEYDVRVRVKGSVGIGPHLFPSGV